MARTNKPKLAESLIENELFETDQKIEMEVKTEHYINAGGFQNYRAGLVRALGFVKVCSGQGDETPNEDKS